MIQKQKLVEFIQRYYLAGNTDSVKITVDGDELSTTFKSEDSNVVGTVIGRNFNNIEDGELGIYTTGQLLKMLSVLDSEIEIDYVGDATGKAYAIKVSDGDTSISYMLADLAVIPPTPKMKTMPTWDVVCNITKDFTDKFLKAKSGMPEAENFAVECNGDSTNIILNYATINTNRIVFPVTTTSSKKMTTTCFSANILKEVLAANKAAETAVLEVSQAGLAKVTFTGSEFESTYYLLKLNVQ